MLLLLVLALLSVSHARLVNVTIDDTTGDARTGLLPQYISTDRWDGGKQPGAFNGTFHSRSSDLPGNISIRFTGSRIYTYFGFWPANVVDLSFFLNGEFAGQYTRGPGGGPGPIDWVYGEMDFGSDQLLLAEHTLLVVSPGGEATTLQFDYAIYTTEESDTGDGHPSSSTASSSLVTPTAPRATGSTTSSTRISAIPPSAKLGASTDRNTQSSAASHSTHQQPRPGATRSGHNVRSAVGPAVGGGAGPLLVLVCGALFIWRRRRRSPDPLRPLFARQNPLAQTNVADKSRLWEAVLKKPAVPDLGDSADLRAQLERVRAENERQLGEIALLRRAAAPPPYSDSSRPRRMNS